MGIHIISKYFVQEKQNIERVGGNLGKQSEFIFVFVFGYIQEAKYWEINFKNELILTAGPSG